MKSLCKLVVKMGLLTLLSAMPLSAQIAIGLELTTSFPFYAGNTKLPAGTYKVSQTNIDSTILLIESTNSVHSAYLDITPTETEQPHPQSSVTFHKYGGVDYLNQIWVQGESSGMQADPTKAETKAAASSSAEDHSVPAKKR
jgi:hypothetical protein